MTRPTIPARNRRIRILFVGEIHSSHAQSWIRLLDGQAFEIRCFQTTMTPLPPGLRLEHLTYIPVSGGEDEDPAKIRFGASARLKMALVRWKQPDIQKVLAWRWLVSIIRDFRPDIVHTLGLTEGATFLETAIARFRPHNLGRWVMQLRGGSDLALNHADPFAGPSLARLAARGDAIVTDNQVNFEYLERLGTHIPEGKRLIAPGTGGVDVGDLASRWTGRTRDRRLILWPKAYESPWSKALPVLEALRNAWEQIGPFRIEVLACDPEVARWIRLMPQAMAEAFTIHGRITQEQVVGMMLKARVMLAPSLIDGTPNTMWEAMACGAVPIVSPLKTITPVAQADRNALFARNLYPEEISAQLVRAMSDDDLAEEISVANLLHVRRHADRAIVGPRLEAFYRSLL